MSANEPKKEKLVSKSGFSSTSLRQEGLETCNWIKIWLQKPMISAKLCVVRMKEHMQVSELSFGWHSSVHVIGPLGNGTSASKKPCCENTFPIHPDAS